MRKRLFAPVMVGWVGADDGFLVRDLNGNGLIDSGAELFGDATQLSGGQTAADGFAALADLAVDSFTSRFTNTLPVSEAANDEFLETKLRRKA